MSGHRRPPPLAEEASKQVAGGYRAVKLRLGDTLKRDIERTLALRSELGPTWPAREVATVR
jgi:D-galactarolactone cycloisomerase